MTGAALEILAGVIGIVLAQWIAERTGVTGWPVIMMEIVGAGVGASAVALVLAGYGRSRPGL